MTLPRLKQDTERLYKVWNGYQIMRSRDLVKEFNISRRTACKIIKAGGRQGYIAVDVLFDLYEWSPEVISEKYRRLMGGIA